MKNILKLALVLICAVVLTTSVSYSSPLSSCDVTLENTSTGQTFNCKTDASGKFEVKDLPPGTYSFRCVVNGEEWSLGSSSSQLVVSPRDVASGQASGKRDAATGQASGKRDAATGQATGKRTHKPITITKELDKSTPMLRTSSTGPSTGGSSESTSGLKVKEKGNRTKCSASLCIDGSCISGTLTTSRQTQDSSFGD